MLTYPRFVVDKQSEKEPPVFLIMDTRRERQIAQVETFLHAKICCAALNACYANNELLCAQRDTNNPEPV